MKRCPRLGIALAMTATLLSAFAAGASLLLPGPSAISVDPTIRLPFHLHEQRRRTGGHSHPGRGGTVSDISKDSITIFAQTEQTILLEPAESVVVTYSSAPTMVKDRK